MEEGFFCFFVVDMAANTANGVNFSIGDPTLAPESSRTFGGQGGDEHPISNVQAYRFAIFCVNDWNCSQSVSQLQRRRRGKSPVRGIANTEWFRVDWVPPFFEPEAFGLFGGIVGFWLRSLVVGCFSGRGSRIFF